jgi:tetratricopeptide (TPR) repeat protein
LLSFVAVIVSSQWLDAHRAAVDPQMEEERLYLTGKTLKRMSLGFNGLVADWYWMRSLQYVGQKIINHPGEFQLDDLSPLNLRLLYPLLDTATTLDPKFAVAYQYGAVVLPAISEDDAIRLIKKGMAENPENWRLYQHLGYIYWKRGDYKLAGEAYGEGARIAGAPRWMQEMSGRMAAEGGSHAMAREIYQRLYEETNDTSMKELMARRLMQVDSFEERDAIRDTLIGFRDRRNRCPTSWTEDPADTPYVLSNDGCEVNLDLKSKVPLK